MANLADLFLEKDSKICDKWEQYFGVYTRELGRFSERGRPVDLLEIGVQNGGSLELWSQFLPADSMVIGMDIDPKVGSMSFGNENVKAFSADATDLDEIERSLGSSTFDVIIDDGSHTSTDIIASFTLLFDRLKPGGLYMIEDLHCSYMTEFEGGYCSGNSSMEWLKRLTDAINCDHIRRSDIDAETLGEFRLLNRSLACVTFYDSICVVEKLSVEKARPYRRLISGEVSEVAPLIESLIDSRPRYVFDTVLFGRATLRQANARLLGALEARIEKTALLERQLAWVRREAGGRIETLDRELAEALRSLSALQAEVADLRRQREDLLRRELKVAPE